MRKKTLSRILTLVMALSLLSTTGFAASFSDLQNAINSKSDTTQNQTEGGYYGYAKHEDGTYGITAKTNEDGTREVNLHEKVEAAEGDNTGKAAVTINKKNQDVTINMNGNVIDGEDVGRKGALISVSNGVKLTVNGGSSAEDTAKRGSITGGNNQKTDWSGGGGAFCVKGSEVTLNNIDLTGNHADYHGGAMQLTDSNVNGSNGGKSKVTLNRVTMKENTAKGDGGAINMFGTDVFLNGTDMINNKADNNGGAIWVGLSGMVTFDEDSRAVENHSHTGDDSTGIANDICIGDNSQATSERITGEKNSVIYDSSTYDKTVSKNDDGFDIFYCSHKHTTSATCTDSETCDDCGAELNSANGHVRGAPVEENRIEPQPGTSGSYDLVVYCSVCGTELSRETITIPALPMPIDFGDGTGDGADTGTTIADEATPLEGLFTRADAIGYLWEHTGSPEAELSTFADVPEDHYWAVAIGWAEDNGIALPDEEGNFRPDDLVLRTSNEPEGELQEFLNRYAVFAGVELEPDELFFVLDGAADDVIMGEDAQVIFDAFFAKLEKTLAEQEKAA